MAAYLKPKYIDAFLKASNYNIKRGILLDTYDEPTYLGFFIEFEFNENESQVPGDFDTLPEGLLKGFSSDYSAEKYLYNIGYRNRANNLKFFKEILRSISTEVPFYIKSISGLNEILKIDPNKSWRENEYKINLTFLEGLDLRTSAMFDFYKKAVYDNIYNRYLLPDIMRYFTMNVYISEIRTFHKPRNLNVREKAKPSLDNILGYTNNDPVSQKMKDYENYFNSLDAEQTLKQDLFNIKNKKLYNEQSNPFFLEYLDEHISIIKIKLSQCEFILNEFEPTWGGDLDMSNISNDSKSEYKVGIKVNKVKEYASYPVIYGAIRESLSKITVAQPELTYGPQNENIDNEITKNEKEKLISDKNLNDDLLAKFDVYFKNQSISDLNLEPKTLFKKIQGIDNDPNAVYTNDDSPYKKGHLTKEGFIKDKTIGEKLLEDFTKFGLSKVEETLTFRVDNVFLGNVYNISPSTFLSAASTNPNLLTSGLSSFLNKLLNNEDQVNFILNNIYENIKSIKNESNPGNIELQGTSINQTNLDNINLTGQTINTPPNAGNIDLQSTNINTTNPGNIELQSPTINTQTQNNIGFTNIPINNQNPSNINFTSNPINTQTQNNIGFINNPINTQTPSNIGLTGQNISINPPSNIDLNGAEPKKDLESKIDFENTNLNLKNPGNVNFEQTNKNLKNINNIEFNKDLKQNKDLENINFKSNEKNIKIENKIDFENMNLTKNELGNIGFIMQPQNNNQNNNQEQQNIQFEGINRKRILNQKNINFNESNNNKKSNEIGNIKFNDLSEDQFKKPESNVYLNQNESNNINKPDKIEFNQTKKTQDDLGNINLQSNFKLDDLKNKNINFESKNTLKNLEEKNINFNQNHNQNQSTKDVDKNIDFIKKEQHLKPGDLNLKNNDENLQTE